ncbi:TMP-TENI-domain-containing protein [Ramaria rubella]|nr:TMP-TENI-domain-containing protein [Ramaria rubella]
MAARPFDYSLYLVTSRELLPLGKDYFESLEESIRGGVTIVQIREKTAETGEFLSIAARTKEICHKHRIPVIINDRVDIALAIQADGVHLGQSDMPIPVARKLLPPGTIIGTSVNTPHEAKKAKEDGADYVGIGALWDTQSKQLTSPVLGVRGVGRILEALAGSYIKAVAIGGIKNTNALRALHGAVAPSNNRCLDGLAVISEIVASKEPLEAAKKLAATISAFKSLASPPVFSFISRPNVPLSAESIVQEAAELLTTIKSLTPLVHQITNTVVTTQSANATLALGASPIMSNAPEEMQDLSRIIGSLLINIGTIANKEGMLSAGRWANINRKPVVFDPVAVSATNHRRMATRELLNDWQPSVIKGNAGEIGALAETTEVKSRGVDSVGSGFADPASVVRSLARKERCIVVLTGETDWLSDGEFVLRSDNGDPLLGSITGSGCIAGTCIATFCAAVSLSAVQDNLGTSARLVKGNMLVAALGGMLALTVASEIAATRPDVKGTGSFLPALIDELYNLTPTQVIKRAKVEVVQ